MFFAPVLHALLRASSRSHAASLSPSDSRTPSAHPRPRICALSLSLGAPPPVGTGGDGDRHLRARELQRAYELLGVLPARPALSPCASASASGVGSSDGASEGSSEGNRGNALLLVDDPFLQDGMANEWEAHRVVEAVLGKLREVGVLALDGDGDADADAAGNGDAAEPAPTTPTWILTFDEGGISGHANHRALSRAAPLLAEVLREGPHRYRDQYENQDQDDPHSRQRQQGGGPRLRPRPRLRRLQPRIYANPTLPLAQKYGSLPWALAQRAWDLVAPVPVPVPTQEQKQKQEQEQEQEQGDPRDAAGVCLAALSSPAEYARSLRAMREGHASQMAWFRWGWWVASSYVYGGRVCPVG